MEESLVGKAEAVKRSLVGKAQAANRIPVDNAQGLRQLSERGNSQASGS